jgi:hypothetical protein
MNIIFCQEKHTLQDLLTLEEMHHSNNIKYYKTEVLDVYIWLGQKFPESFKEMDKAQEFKEKVCSLIDKILDDPLMTL